jgi:hypothetical protein
MSVRLCLRDKRGRVLSTRFETLTLDRTDYFNTEDIVFARVKRTATLDHILAELKTAPFSGEVTRVDITEILPNENDPGDGDETVAIVTPGNLYLRFRIKDS